MEKRTNLGSSKPIASSLAVVAIGYSLLAGVACGGQNKAQEPVKATMTTTGVTSYQTTPAGDASAKAIEPVKECKNVLTCYQALARDLCMNNDPSCTSSFEVTAPVDNKQVCQNMLTRARDIAKPYVESKHGYKYPRECKD